MFERMKEYFKLGAGRPPGTMWAMEKAYFEFRRKYPGREEHFYLRLALQSRYREKGDAWIEELVSRCPDLDWAIVRAVGVDFGNDVAFRFQWDVLVNLPPCSLCGKYRALSTTDLLCYGCRKYPGFAACTKCHLYWNDYPKACRRCGGEVRRITDGPGVLTVPLADDRPIHSDVPAFFESMERAEQEGSPDQSQVFARLKAEMESLEKRYASIWDASLRERRQYRELRRSDPLAARQFIQQSRGSAQKDETLIPEFDGFFDVLNSLYLGADAERRTEIRALMDSHKRLLENLRNYAARAAIKLKQTGEWTWLVRGLVAASIDTGRSTEDWGLTLAELYKNALDHGLGPSEYFWYVANLSNGEMRNALENFESSRDFTVFVKPRLDQR